MSGGWSCRRHRSLLHYAPRVDERVISSTGVGEPNPQGGVQGVSLAMVSSRKVCLQVLPVHVYAINKTIMTWAILDEGSGTSLFEKGLAKESGIKGKLEEFELTTVNDPSEVRQGSEVALAVRGEQDVELIEIPEVLTVDSIPVSRRSIPSQADLDKWPHLKGIELPTIDDNEVRLTISSDTPEAFWVMDERRGRWKELYAILSPVDWTLVGPMSKDTSSRSFAVNHISHDSLQDQLKRFWQLDHSLKGCDEEKVCESVEDSREREIMNYEIGLPWRHHPAYFTQ